MPPLKAWLKSKLVQHAQSTQSRNISEPWTKGNVVQIIEFITWQHPFWALVSDMTHYLVVKFTRESLEAFESYGSTVTSFRYSLIRLDSYRPIVVARSSNAPKEIAIEILSLRVFSQTESFTLCEQARSVNELQAVKQWVMTLSSHNPQNAEPELVPESTPDPNMLAPQPDKPEHRRHSDLFPTPPERRKLVTSSPPCADRLGMEWWDFSPSPEPEANLAGRNAIRHSMNVDEPLSKCHDRTEFSPSPLPSSSSGDELQVRKPKTRDISRFRAAGRVKTATTAIRNQHRMPSSTLPRQFHSPRPRTEDSSQTEPPSQPAPAMKTAAHTPQSSQTETHSSPSHSQLFKIPASSYSPPRSPSSTGKRKRAALGKTSSIVLVANSDSENSFTQSQERPQNLPTRLSTGVPYASATSTSSISAATTVLSYPPAGQRSTTGISSLMAVPSLVETGSPLVEPFYASLSSNETANSLDSSSTVFSETHPLPLSQRSHQLSQTSNQLSQHSNVMSAGGSGTWQSQEASSIEEPMSVELETDEERKPASRAMMVRMGQSLSEEQVMREIDEELTGDVSSESGTEDVRETGSDVGSHRIDESWDLEVTDKERSQVEHKDQGEYEHEVGNKQTSVEPSRVAEKVSPEQDVVPNSLASPLHPPRTLSSSTGPPPLPIKPAIFDETWRIPAYQLQAQRSSAAPSSHHMVGSTKAVSTPQPIPFSPSAPLTNETSVTVPLLQVDSVSKFFLPSLQLSNRSARSSSSQPDLFSNQPQPPSVSESQAINTSLPPTISPSRTLTECAPPKLVRSTQRPWPFSAIPTTSSLPPDSPTEPYPLIRPLLHPNYPLNHPWYQREIARLDAERDIVNAWADDLRANMKE